MKTDRKTTHVILTAAVAVLLMTALIFSSTAAYLGDVDLNGKVQASDARRILRHAAKLELIADEQALPLADVDGSGKVAAADARLALRMASKMDPLVEASAEEPTTAAPTTDEPTTAAPVELEPDAYNYRWEIADNKLLIDVSFENNEQTLKPEISVVLVISDHRADDIIADVNNDNEQIRFSKIYDINKSDYREEDNNSYYSISVDFSELKESYSANSYAYCIPCTESEEGSVAAIDSIKLLRKNIPELHLPHIEIEHPRSADIVIKTDDDNAKMMTMFIGFKGDIAVDAEFSLSLVCEDGTSMYQNSIPITSDQFKMQPDGYGRNRLCAIIEIPYSEMERGYKSTGTLSGKFTFPDGWELELDDMSLRYLPFITVADSCSLTLPTLPATYSYYNYNDEIDSSFRIDNVEYDFSAYEGDTKATLKLTIAGEKTYDINGNRQSSYCTIGYKVYDSEGYVIATGTIYTDGMSVGEKTRSVTETVYGDFIPGEYRIEFLNVN